MAAVTTAIKVGVLVSQHWKKLLYVIVGLLFLIIMIPVAAISAFLPSSEESKAAEYKSVAEKGKLGWVEMMAFDTVRYENDFSSVDPNNTAFDFFYAKVDKYRNECVETTKVKGVWRCVERDWEFVETDVLNNKNDITAFLSDNNERYSPSDFKSVIESLDDLDSKRRYDIRFEKRHLSSLMASHGFSDDKKEWTLELISSGAIYEMYDLENINIVDADPTIYNSKGWVWPTVSTRITSDFGYRVSPCSGCSSFHGAVDVGATKANVAGDPIFAMDDGRILVSKHSTSGGNMVIIKHENGVISKYLHLMSRYVQPGMPVEKGKMIGRMGTTGYSTGVHLDFSIHFNGKPVNPLAYFEEVG